MGQRLWAGVDPEYLQTRRENRALAREDLSSDHTPVHEFAFKLSRIKDTLFTPTAKELAEERHRFMAQFFTRLEAEVKGES
jgi:HD superfamily phosphodiesterase